MENKPVIVLSARSPAPGADPATYERYVKWATEVWTPLNFTAKEVRAIDHYRNVKENPAYPARVSINHYQNLNEWRASNARPEMSAISEEIKSWQERGINDQIWHSVYVLLKSFRRTPDFSNENEITWIDNAQIIHLEAYRLSQEDQVKYRTWFTDYGSIIFMPLFMKIPGLLGYDWFKDTGLDSGRNVPVYHDYPPCLSIIYIRKPEGL